MYSRVSKSVVSVHFRHVEPNYTVKNHKLKTSNWRYMRLNVCFYTDNRIFL